MASEPTTANGETWLAGVIPLAGPLLPEVVEDVLYHRNDFVFLGQRGQVDEARLKSLWQAMFGLLTGRRAAKIDEPRVIDRVVACGFIPVRISYAENRLRAAAEIEIFAGALEIRFLARKATGFDVLAPQSPAWKNPGMALQSVGRCHLTG